jgi:hypothetical protein
MGQASNTILIPGDLRLDAWTCSQASGIGKTVSIRYTVGELPDKRPSPCVSST